MRQLLLYSLALFASNLVGQPLPSHDEVFNKYIKAIGGHKEILGVSDIKITMKVTIGASTAKCILKKKTPNKFHVPWVVNNQELVYIISDGQTIGTVNANYNNNFKEEDSLDFWFIYGLIAPEIYYSILEVNSRVEGIESVDGTDCYSIVNTTVNNSITWTDYYAIHSGLKVRSIFKWKDHTSDKYIVVQQKLYRRYKSIMLPSIVAVEANDSKSIFVVERVKVNSGVRDYEFNAPQSVSAAQRGGVAIWLKRRNH